MSLNIVTISQQTQRSLVCLLDLAIIISDKEIFKIVEAIKHLVNRLGLTLIRCLPNNYIIIFLTTNTVMYIYKNNNIFHI